MAGSLIGRRFDRRGLAWNVYDDCRDRAGHREYLARRGNKRKWLRVADFRNGYAGRMVEPGGRVWDVLDARLWRNGRFEWLAFSDGELRWVPQPFFQMFDRV